MENRVKSWICQEVGLFFEIVGSFHVFHKFYHIHSSLLGQTISPLKFHTILPSGAGVLQLTITRLGPPYSHISCPLVLSFSLSLLSLPPLFFTLLVPTCSAFPNILLLFSSGRRWRASLSPVENVHHNTASCCLPSPEPPHTVYLQMLFLFFVFYSPNFDL